jgi:hypothetical protein
VTRSIVVLGQAMKWLRNPSDPCHPPCMNLPVSRATLAALLLVASSALAEDIKIFNGKDLTGWEGGKGLWSVEEGVITGKSPEDPEKPGRNPLSHNTFLVWKGGTVSDFELHLKYRILTPAGNSGIQYRSKVINEGPFGPIVGGYQADFEAGKTYSGILYEEKGRGILAKRGEQVVIKPAENDPTKHKVEVTGSVGSSEEIQATIKPGEWNEYVIIAKGNHLQHFINGKKTVDVTDTQEKAAAEGVLAFQMHAGPPMTVQFKDLVLKSLK